MTAAAVAAASTASTPSTPSTAWRGMPAAATTTATAAGTGVAIAAMLGIRGASCGKSSDPEYRHCEGSSCVGSNVHKTTFEAAGAAVKYRCQSECSDHGELDTAISLTFGVPRFGRFALGLVRRRLGPWDRGPAGVIDA